MAKVPNLKGDRQISEEMRAALKERGGITHWSFDSTARILADTLTTEMARTNAEDRRAFESLQLSSAEGEDLDYLAFEWSGMSRKNPTFAYAKENHKNLFFYVQNQAYGAGGATGTFGDINSGNDITIPGGTLISSKKDITSANAVIYRVDTETTLYADTSVAWVSATAITMGSGMNCADNTLRYHDFNNYTENSFYSLKCNNRFPILTGSNREEDGDLRFRAAQYHTAFVQNNLSKIMLSGISVPGVENVKLLNGYFGIGSAAVVVFGMDNETSPVLTKAFQQTLSSIQGPGLQLISIPGVKVYFDFDVRALVSKEPSMSEASEIKAAIGNMLRAALKEFESINVITISKLAQVVSQAHPLVTGLISRVDSPNNNRKAGFENVYVRKTVADDTPAVDRLRITQNRYILKQEEMVALGDVSIELVTKA